MDNLKDINSEYISLSRISSYIRNLHTPAEAKVILTDPPESYRQRWRPSLQDREKGSRDRDHTGDEISGNHVSLSF